MHIKRNADTPEEFLNAFIDEAKRSLARTPELLPVLKKAGVVDSGAAGLIATGMMIVLLLITKYMSLSTTFAMLLCPILLIPFGASIAVVLIAAACALFMAIRHKENFKRLIQGRESKFVLKSHKEK